MAASPFYGFPLNISIPESDGLHERFDMDGGLILFGRKRQRGAKPSHDRDQRKKRQHQ